MKQSYIPLRIALGIVAAIHIIIGFLALIPAYLSIVVAFHGGSIQGSPQLAQIVSVFGAYLLVVGALGIYALWDPVKNKSVIHVLIFLFLIRVIQRILFASQASTLFGVTQGYYWLQTILYFLILLALVYFRPRTAKKAEA